MSLMENGEIKEMTKDTLRKLKEKRMFLSDSDSNIICLLIDKVEVMNAALHTIQIISSTMEDNEHTNAIFTISDKIQLD